MGMEFGTLGTLFSFCQVLFRNRSAFTPQELEVLAAYFAKQVSNQ